MNQIGQKENENILSLGFISLAAMYAAVYLEGGVCPGGITLAWLGVAFLSLWGLGWSSRNFAADFRKHSDIGRSKLGEIIIWGFVMLGALVLAVWKLRGLALNLLPSLALFSIAIGLITQSSVAAGIIRGVGLGMPAILGWATVHHSLFQQPDWGIWLLFSSLVLWVIGNDLYFQGVLSDQDDVKERRISFLGWSRVFHLISMVPLFFLGQFEEMGVVYGIGLIFIFILSEIKFRKFGSQDFKINFLVNSNYFSALILLAMIIYGRSV